MKIAADKNILFAQEAFSTLGEIKLFDLNDITNKNIADFDIFFGDKVHIMERCP